MIDVSESRSVSKVDFSWFISQWRQGRAGRIWFKSSWFNSPVRRTQFDQFFFPYKRCVPFFRNITLKPPSQLRDKCSFLLCFFFFFVLFFKVILLASKQPWMSKRERYRGHPVWPRKAVEMPIPRSHWDSGRAGRGQLSGPLGSASTTTACCSQLDSQSFLEIAQLQKNLSLAWVLLLPQTNCSRGYKQRPKKENAFLSIHKPRD